MKEKFSHIRWPWHRLYITLLVVFFYCRDKWLIRSRPRYRAHWIGRRHRRPERLFIVLVFAAAMIVLEDREYAVWATIAGGFIALLFPVLFFHYQLMHLLAEID